MPYEIELNQGVGPLRLGMTQAEVSRILGAPTRQEDPAAYDFLDEEDRVYLRDQLVETREKTGDLPIIDLLYHKNRLVSITLDGKTRDVTLLGRALADERAQALNALQRLGGEVFINGESYFFEQSGIVLTRTKARKDINYAEIVDSKFQKLRLAFDCYKPHTGPIIP
jgi:hypothetical protein